MTQNSIDQPYQSNKGDLMGGTGSGGRPAILPVGTNSYAVVADSTQTTGLNYGPVPQSWTPVLNFGGSSTGITYSSQIGSYMQIGNLVYFSGSFVLTSKGSSTGGAAITGLPPLAIASGAVSIAVTIIGSNLTLDSGYTYMYGSMTNTGLTGQILVSEAGSNMTPGSVFDTSFANNTALYFSGMYQST